MQNLIRNVCNMWQCLKQTTVDITVCCLTVFISLSLIDTLVRRAGMRHPQPPWYIPQNLKELPKNDTTAQQKDYSSAKLRYISQKSRHSSFKRQIQQRKTRILQLTKQTKPIAVCICGNSLVSLGALCPLVPQNP